MARTTKKQNNIVNSESMERFNSIIKEVRNMKALERVYNSTGDSQLDLAFMLARNEVKFLMAYADSESAYKVLNKIQSDMTAYQLSFNNTEPYTDSVYMAEEIVLSVYCILKEYNLTLKTIWNTDVTIQKLSKSRITYGGQPKVKECIVKAYEYIDSAIAKVINSEKDSVDLASDKIYEKHEISEDLVYYEEKPSDSVFTSPYAITIAEGGEIDLELTEDIELSEAISVMAKRCKWSVTQTNAMRLYFVHNLTISACRLHWSDGFNSSESRLPEKRLKKYLSEALESFTKVYDISVFSDSQLDRLNKDGIIELIEHKKAE